MKDEKNINPLFASSLPYIYVLVVFRLLNHLTSKNEVMTFLSIVVFFFFFSTNRLSHARLYAFNLQMP
jgi:hypothetical protein